MTIPQSADALVSPSEYEAAAWPIAVPEGDSLSSLECPVSLLDEGDYDDANHEYDSDNRRDDFFALRRSFGLRVSFLFFHNLSFLHDLVNRSSSTDLAWILPDKPI